MSNEMSRLRNRWNSMIQRCYNPNAHAYDRYGGRGITVCDRWRNSFAVFVEDMGVPSEGESLDRVDNDGPYCPENCAWSSAIQQARNMRSNVSVEIAGQSKLACEWDEEFGLRPGTVASRFRAGIDSVDLLKPVGTIRGKYKVRRPATPEKPYGRPKKDF